MRLKEKVTTNPSSIIQKASGIPPHVEQMKKQRELLNLSNEVLGKVNGMCDSLRGIINDVFEERAIESGVLMHQQMKELLNNFSSDIQTKVKNQIDTLKNNGIGNDDNRDDNNGEYVRGLRNAGNYG